MCHLRYMAYHQHARASQCAFAAFIASATPTELVAFAHAALFSPALSTLHGALARGYLSHFLGLTTKTLTKHPPQSVAMVKDHLDQARQNQRSTKPKSGTRNNLPPDLSNPTHDDDTFPPSDLGNPRTRQCFAAVVEPATGQIQQYRSHWEMHRRVQHRQQLYSRVIRLRQQCYSS